jgi:ribonuclease P protein component
MTDASPKIGRLKVRAEFLKAAKAPYQARGAVVIQARDRGDGDEIRSGFTATKKIGGAVERNRAKRRLREAARVLLPLHGLPGHDYVFVARATTIDRDWAGLLDDVKAALIRLSCPKTTPTSNTDTASREKTVR